MSDHPVALVTGGGSGLGAALSRHLARSGWDVGIHYHTSQNSAEEVLRDVGNIGRQGILLQADLASDMAVGRIRDQFSKRFNHLELLVNNAGVYHEKAFADLTEAEWFTELNSTATAVYFTTRSFLPLLRASRGRVINIGDSACDRPGARVMAPAYHIGKTGVYILTRSFAKAEALHGVAVNLQSPLVCSKRASGSNPPLKFQPDASANSMTSLRRSIFSQPWKRPTSPDRTSSPAGAGTCERHGGSA